MSTIATLATAAGTTGLQGWIKSQHHPAVAYMVGAVVFVLPQYLIAVRGRKSPSPETGKGL